MDIHASALVLAVMLERGGFNSGKSGMVAIAVAVDRQ